MKARGEIAVDSEADRWEDCRQENEVMMHGRRVGIEQNDRRLSEETSTSRKVLKMQAGMTVMK